jgi:hypothetical protein
MSHAPSKRQIQESLFERLHYERDEGAFYWELRSGKLKRAGWVDQYGYRLIRIDKVLYREHHLVWLKETGEWPSFEIDHKDGDPSNNCYKNLRKADRHGQGANQALQKRREGKWKGVHETTSGKFGVKIKHKGKQITGLGHSYTDPREAALVYNHAAEKYFKGYARFNQVFEDFDQ